MSVHVRKNIARIALVSYLLAGLLIELGHRDSHDIRLASNPALSSHECGDKEIHIPLDKRHECLACSQSTQRLCIEGTGYVGMHVLLLGLTGTPVLVEHPLTTDVFHSGKRGPPSFPA